MPIYGGDEPANCCTECSPQNVDWNLPETKHPTWLELKRQPVAQEDRESIIKRLRERWVVDQMRELVSFFKDGRSGTRKGMSASGSVLVLNLQTVLLKPKCLQHLNGKWVSGAPEAKELLQRGVPLCYDPTNRIWTRLWRNELWGDVPGLGDLPYNDVTVGDTLEALTSVYIRHWEHWNFHRRPNGPLNIPLSDEFFQWFMETGMDLLSQLSALQIWEWNIGTRLTTRLDFNSMD